MRVESEMVGRLFCVPMDVAVQRKSTFEEYRKVLGAAEGKSQNFPAEVYE